MVNEIPVSLFITLLVFDFILLVVLLTCGRITIIDGLLPINLIAGVFAAPLTHVLAQSILNGNVVTLLSNDTYRSVQSLPVFYILQGLAVVITILTGFLIYHTIHTYLLKEKTFSALGDPRDYHE